MFSLHAVIRAGLFSCHAVDMPFLWYSYDLYDLISQFGQIGQFSSFGQMYFEPNSTRPKVIKKKKEH